MNRNHLSLALTFISFALFFPGVTLPIFALDIAGKVQTQLGGIEMDILSQNSSIMKTVQQLFESDRIMVAALIFVFSVMVPVAKGLLLVVAYLAKNLKVRARAHGISNAIGKWSMADVFVVAIFLAYLSTHNDTQVKDHVIRLMGMQIPVKAQIDVVSGLGDGFYYFLGYCLTSMVSFQLFKPNLNLDSKT